MKRVDANQSRVVKALRAVGCKVEPRLSQLGKGVPDLLVSSPKKGWLVIEVKNGELPPSKQKLTPDELEWQEKMRPGRVIVVKNEQEALMAVGAYDSQH